MSDNNQLYKTHTVAENGYGLSISKGAVLRGDKRP